MAGRPDELLPRRRRAPRRRGRALAWAVACAALAPAAGAQVSAPVPQPAPSREAFDATPRVMDQGSDRNSLSHSLRVMPVDLSPHGFERVYAVPGRDDLLMRTNGALYAVFDQSTYSRDPQRRGAMRAVVPAATVFYIGRPDFRTIRSTGVRDVDFVQGDASRSPRASSALDSVHGVRRLDGSPIDGRAADAGAAPVDGRASSHGDDPTKPGAGARGESPSTTEGASPEDAPASRPQDPVRADAPAPTAPAPESRPAPPPPPMREDLPGFRDRIDELLRRAKKPS